MLMLWLTKCICVFVSSVFCFAFASTVKLGNKERFDKEQICIKEPFPVTNFRGVFRTFELRVLIVIDCPKIVGPKGK